MLPKALKYISFFLYRLGLTIAGIGLTGVIILFLKNPQGLAIDTCLDNGEVWDYQQNRCRNDCLKWNQEYGCIKLTSKQIALFDKCRGKPGCISAKVYQAICLSNQKAWNNEKQDCFFNFTLTQCDQLTGNWEYPDNCKK